MEEDATPTMHERWVLAVAGGLAAATALATSVFLDGLSTSMPSLIHGVAQAIVRRAPGSVARQGVEAVGTADKPLLVLGTVVLALALGAAVGRAGERRRWAVPVAFLGAGILGALATAWATIDDTGPTLLAGVLAAAAGIAAYEVLLRWGAHEGVGPPMPTERAKSTVPPPAIGLAATRRRFLTTAGFTATGAAVATILGRRLQATAAAEGQRLEVALPPAADPAPATVPAAEATGLEGITPLVTPNADFYRIDEALVVPTVDVDSWALEIKGMVDEPLRLTLDDLLAEDLVERYVTIACVSNQVGGGLIGNALWRGVPLARLLERAGVQAGADQLVGRSVDEFTVGFPTEVALDGRDALVAVGMNGEPLPRDHGFPARLIIPGLYGYVSATKWLQSIELTTWDAFDAYWIERGWAKEGPIKTQSRIDVPRSNLLDAGPVVVAGVAWAQHRGIERVEVRVDDGDWQEATLADAISVDTWRQWHFEWDAPTGRHVLAVRATDGDGEVQTEEYAPVFPDGATGYHTIGVQVS